MVVVVAGGADVQVELKVEVEVEVVILVKPLNLFFPCSTITFIRLYLFVALKIKHCLKFPRFDYQ